MTTTRYLTKAQKLRIIERASDLAELAACKDIDVAMLILGDICRALGVSPTDVPKYNELASLLTGGRP